LAAVCVGTWADVAFGWFEMAFVWVSRLFYEVSPIATIRQPTQVPLARVHLLIVAVGTGLALGLAPWIGRAGRALAAVLIVGYAVRAVLWIIGGNLPCVPGDSAHYIEVARSVSTGQGPVKHYVESFFRDYPAIRQNRGALDDWATPLWAYVLGALFRMLGVGPSSPLEHAVAVAKGASFALNWLCLPALYAVARPKFGKAVALLSTAALAVLPVHAIYAALGLRESLVALVALLAVGATFQSWINRPFLWSAIGGGLTGLAILARNTSLALAVGLFLFGFVANRRRWLAPGVVWLACLGAVIAPWAWETYREYGEPFYTYTKFYAYNFSWTVHHFDQGNTRPAQFFTAANLPEITRVKLRSVGIIAVVSTMIVGVPVAFAFARACLQRVDGADRPGVLYTRMVGLLFVVFAAATLWQVADVTQVEQLGRYYLPVFVLMLPSAFDRLGIWAATISGGAVRWVLGLTLVALWWSQPAWAYDMVWLVDRPFQLHLPALRETGDWIQSHPDAVPPNARILTWFPWELRVVSDRTTILFPRNYSPAHIDRTIRQYGVTHVAWGSFEPPPDIDPESWGPYLDRLRKALGLDERSKLFATDRRFPYPVTLYRLSGERP
jgi:hypothetical protein